MASCRGVMARTEGEGWPTAGVSWRESGGKAGPLQRVSWRKPWGGSGQGFHALNWWSWLPAGRHGFELGVGFLQVVSRCELVEGAGCPTRCHGDNSREELVFFRVSCCELRVGDWAVFLQNVIA
jgi:hypothetical protein